MWHPDAWDGDDEAGTRTVVDLLRRDVRRLRRGVIAGLAITLLCSGVAAVAELAARRQAQAPGEGEDRCWRGEAGEDDDGEARAGGPGGAVITVSLAPPQAAPGLLTAQVYGLGKAGLGRTQTIAEALAPGKVGVLHLWATWCPPCRSEMPVLAAAVARAGWRDGVQVVLVAQREQRAAAEVYAFGQALFARLPGARHVLDNSQDGDGLRAPIVALDPGRLAGARTLPVTVVIDHRGKVRWIRVGALRRGELEAGGELDGLLSELASELPAVGPGRPPGGGRSPPRRVSAAERSPVVVPPITEPPEALSVSPLETAPVAPPTPRCSPACNPPLICTETATGAPLCMVLTDED